MELKEKLQELRNDLHHAVLRNRDYEFDAELENHPLGNQNIYRLYFIDYCNCFIYIFWYTIFYSK